MVDTAPLPRSRTGAQAGDPRAHHRVRPTGRLRWVAVAACAAGVLVSLGMMAHLVPVGSRAGHYRYHYLRLFSPDILWPFLVTALVASVGLWLSHRWYERRRLVVVAAWLAAAVPMQLLIRGNDDIALQDLVTSQRANGFLEPARAYGIWEFLSGQADIGAALDSHARTNMAGKTVFYQVLVALTDSPAAMGVLTVAASSLSCLLVYLLAAELLDHRTALYALALSILVPGRLFFLPILNTVSPVPILLALWLFVRFLRRPRRGDAVALGAFLYGTMFFEPLPLALGVVFVALLGWAKAGGRLSWPDTGWLIGLAVAGFAACYAAMRLVVGYDLASNFAYVLDDARGFNGDGHRPYGVWVVRNLWDFAIAAGLPTVLLVAAGVVDAVRRGPWRAGAVLAASAAVTLVVLDLLGVNRGETVRLWIFLAVLWQIPAAWLCARTARLWPIVAVVSATALQAATGMAMIAFVRV
ncbi:glycosyltransferase family 39 protein [Catellatospora tritici]|uniref:glycosyltransferase family 39 protein n=1 Tax=Catellatospora tritici TaxID=2851566 RepID=UPI001C2D1D85|nr:glycosyltransferase family 39 protein [Catellatospora tritici]MBV1851216.1 glycosyltransferase family 39 protein [Catellatospora tritici]